MDVWQTETSREWDEQHEDRLRFGEHQNKKTPPKRVYPHQGAYCDYFRFGSGTANHRSICICLDLASIFRAVSRISSPHS